MTAERNLIEWGEVVVAYLAVRQVGTSDELVGPSDVRCSLRFRTAAGESLGEIAVPGGGLVEDYLDDELRCLLSLVRDVAPRE